MVTTKRRPTLTGLPRLFAEPFPLKRRKGDPEPERDTWPSPPPPPSSAVPRACVLEVRTRYVVRRPRLARVALVAVLALYAVTLGVWAALLWGWL